MSDGPTRSEIRLKVRELLGQATLLRARRELERAVERARQAIALDEGDWEPHELLGDLLLDLNRASSALESYRRAQELNPRRVVLEDKIARAALAQAAALRTAERSQALLSGTAKTDSVKRSPAYAALFSLIVPGLGQLYNGQVVKALVVLAAFVFTFALATLSVLRQLALQPMSSMGRLYGPRIDVGALLSSLFGGVSALWVVVLALIWIYAVADAAIRASRTMTSDDTGLV